MSHKSPLNIMDATVTPSSPPLPLTRKNLRALTKMSSTGPSTPTNKDNASQSTTSESSAAKIASVNPIAIREDLETYNIFVHKIKFDSEHFDPSLADFIKAKVTPTRSSPTITEEKHEEITSLFDEYKYDNAITLSSKLGDLIFTKPESFEGITGALHKTAQASFRPGSVPVPDTSDDYMLESLLGKTKVPENPKPDHLYGLKGSKVFSTNELKLLRAIENDTKTVPYLYFPFLSVKWNSESQGDNAHVARSHVATSGAAIVSDMRNLYAHIAPDGNPDALYPDLAARTVCFSCIIAGLNIEIFVHWFRLNEDGKIEWHSTRILAIFWSDYENSFTKLHKILHNIFDWGMIERVHQIKEVLKTLGEQRAAAAATVAGSKRKAPSSSP